MNKYIKILQVSDCLIKWHLSCKIIYPSIIFWPWSICHRHLEKFLPLETELISSVYSAQKRLKCKEIHIFRHVFSLNFILHDHMHSNQNKGNIVWQKDLRQIIYYFSFTYVSVFRFSHCWWNKENYRNHQIW